VVHASGRFGQSAANSRLQIQTIVTIQFNVTGRQLEFHAVSPFPAAIAYSVYAAYYRLVLR
jgi:hypothetical protein